MPGKSAGSPYVYSGLVRWRKCGGPTVAQRQRHLKYAGQEVRSYLCRGYHAMGKAAGSGWLVMEESVTKAVIPFLTNLLESRLGIRAYVESEAWRTQEEQEGRTQRLQGEIEAANKQLRRVEKMVVGDLMTEEEARAFIYEARENIERAGNQLDGLEQKVALGHDLAEAMARVCSDIRVTLELLEPSALQAVVRQVFKRFSIGKKGFGRSHTAWVETYEFTEELKGLLAMEITPGTYARA